MYPRVFATLIASAAILLAAGPSEAPAASGMINISVSKGGVIVSGTSGTGTLRFRKRSYPLVISGIGCCFNLGGAQSVLSGQIANIRQPSDIEGQYSAVTAGVSIGQGQQQITLSNQKGAVLQLTGTMSGLMVNGDLGGLIIELAKKPGRVAAVR